MDNTDLLIGNPEGGQVRVRDFRNGDLGISLRLMERGIGQSFDNDRLHKQAEHAVRQLDIGLGRDYDQHSACMAASVACLARVNGLSRIDHVVLSEARGELRKGENLFVVQGGLSDPAHYRAHMKTQDAIDTPVERSLAQLQVYSEMQQRQPAPPTMDEPRREMAPQMRMG